MEIVIDTSAVLAVLLDEPERASLLASTSSVELLASATLPYELGNAVSSLVKRRKVTSDEATAIWRSFQAIQVALRDIDVGAAIQLAVHEKTYAYDAYVVRCAIEARAPLLTLDAQMRKMATRAGVALYGEERS